MQEKENKGIAYLISLGTFLILYLIGEMLNWDMISPVSYQDGEVTISFIGIILFVMTVLIVFYIITKRWRNYIISYLFEALIEVVFTGIWKGIKKIVNFFKRRR